MSRKNKIICLVSVVLAVALIIGAGTAAAADFGSQSDPLVTLSYIDDIFTPEILSAFQEKLDSMEESYLTMFDSKLGQFTQQIQGMLSDGSGVSSTDVFTVVILSRGQKLTCSAGAEVMVRSGSAISYGEGEPLLSDLTSGSSVNAVGTALDANHLYLVSIAGNGLYAAADDVQVLVRGSYTVS